MSFLHPAMLWTLLAVAAPILIHLLNKRRFRVVLWGATMFLKNSLSHVQRRLEWRHLLLLLLRTSAIALMALAMARPMFLRESSAALARARTDMLLLLDASLSMQWSDGRETNFERAKRAAAELIGTLQAGDSVSVWRVTDRATLLQETTFDLHRARKAIEAAQPSFGGTNHLSALDAVAQSLRSLRNPNREMYLLTDARAVGWRLERETEWEILKETLAQMRPRPSVRIFSVAPPQLPNTAVVGLWTFPQMVGVGQAIRADARIANGSATPQTVVATFTVNGTPKSATTLTLPAGQTVTTSFYHAFETHGAQSLGVRISEDALRGDNQRTHALDVLRAFPVLLVNGAPSPKPFQGATDFLVAAFTGSLVQAAVVDARALPAQNLSPFTSVALADVQRLTEEDVKRLEDFVRAGGGALFALGGNIEPSFYNTTLQRDGQSLGVGRIADSSVQPFQNLTSFLTIAPPPYSHPALENFNDPSRGDLTRARIQRYHRIEPDEGNTAVRVVARLSNGDPWLVEKRFGHGRVLWLTTPLTTEWSDLTARPWFVPLAHELMFYLGAHHVARHNFITGEPITAEFPAAEFPSVAGTLQTPSGDAQPLDFARTGKTWLFRYTNTEAPGLYQAEVRGETASRVITFAVNSPSEESDLTPLTENQRLRLSEMIGASFADARADARTLRRGSELWPALVKLVFALLLVETFLAGRWSRRAKEPPDLTTQTILGGRIIRRQQGVTK